MNINTHSCDNCAQNCCLLPVQSLAIPWLYSLRVSCDILTLITHTHAPWHNSIYSTSSLSLLSYCTPFIFNHHCLTHAHPISPASPTSASIFPAPYLLIDSDAEISPLTPPPPSPSVADRMTMPVLIRARISRCSTRLSTGLWERVLLILASGDGLKMTGPKTSKHCLVTLTYSTHTHRHTSHCM